MISSIEWIVQQLFFNNSTTLKDKVSTSFVGTWFGVEGANFTRVSLRKGANSPLLADVNL